jgi:hypothetical protein
MTAAKEAMMESTFLVHRCDSPDGTLLFGVELAENVRVLWKFRREDYKDGPEPWTVQAASAVLRCSRTLSISGKAELTTAGGAVIFETSGDNVLISGLGYIGKLYMSLFASILIALADALAPFQKRDQDE